MSFTSQSYVNELIIDDENAQQHADDFVQGGEQRQRGRIPRDYSVKPYGSLPYAAKMDIKPIPRSEWEARIKEMEETRSRLSDLMLSRQIPSLDQNGTNYCNPPETLIRMEDGSQKRIDKVRENDLVVTAEGNIGKVSKILTRQVLEPLLMPVMVDHTGLQLTGGHPVLTQRGYIRASGITPLDKIAFPKNGCQLVHRPAEETEKHYWVEVLHVGKRNYDGTVYNLEVEGDNSYVAEDIGVHNCWTNGVVTAIYGVRTLARLPHIDLSPASVAAPIKGFSNQGGWGAEALEYIIQHGIATASEWPANAIDRKYDNDDSRASRTKHKVTEWYDMESSNLDQLITCLLLRFPVAIGLNWWSHEVCAIDPVWQDGTIAIRIRNSWGPSYGHQGFAILKGNQMIPDDQCCPRVFNPTLI